MKKLTYVVLALAFAFLAIGSVSAVVSEANNTNSRAEVAKERGLENAESRIERVMERIRKMNLGDHVDLKGLENALRRIVRNQGKDKVCLEIASGLEFETEGEEVEVLREVLEELGYYDDDFEDEESDEYGWGIAKAIYDYQEDNDIKTDSDMERLGFKLSEETRTKLNEEYDCEEEEKDEDEDDEDEEDEDDEDEKVVEDCERDAECGWVSTNCCPENAGANWECVNKEETDFKCDEDVVCPQVVSPKPTTSCQCDDGECEEYEEEDEDSEDDEDDEDDESDEDDE